MRQALAVLIFTLATPGLFGAPRLSLAPASVSPPGAAAAAPGSAGRAVHLEKGMNYVAWHTGDYSSPGSDQSLRNLGATSAQWIALVVTGYQTSIAATNIVWAPPRTPSDGDLAHAVATAHRLGLKVMLKPHVDVIETAHRRGEIGGTFSRAGQWDAWFRSYRKALLHYADLAQTLGVEQLAVGTELVSLSGRERDWRHLVEEVRKRFAGPLVYASNHGGEEAAVRWWDAVDYIGVNAYYPLTAKANPTADDLKAAWTQRGYVALLNQLAQSFHKPILFTEIGYRSVNGAAQVPWDWARPSAFNEREQANAYQAAIDTFRDRPWFAGFFWWDWIADPHKGGAGDTDYTPFGKLAETILKNFNLSQP